MEGVGDFPNSPEVKASASNAGCVGRIPVWGTKIPHASWPKKNKTENRKNIVTNSIKTFKTVHIRKSWGHGSVKEKAAML